MLTDAEKRRLTAQELLEAERTEQQIADRRQEEKDDYDFFSAAINILDLNPDATSVKGRRLTNRATSQSRHESRGAPSLMEYLLLSGNRNITLKDVREGVQTLMACFSAARNTEAKPDIRIAATDKYEFDLVPVSPETQKTIDREAGIMRTRLMALETIEDYSARRVEQDKIEILAREFDMIVHPTTGEYVHSFSRVVEMERTNNPGADACRCTGAVCVFRMRQPQGVGDRGVRSKVGDVLDNDPAEVIASGDHLKGAPPPAFRHS
ncbi:MAG TPA: hypothetical protein VFS88_02460 [Micavibrio sp.]|nr:hypothetical protein [Micavibrio sp.]